MYRYWLGKAISIIHAKLVAMNKHLLVTDARNFAINFEINPYMHQIDQPDTQKSIAQHEAIMQAHRDAGRTLEYLPTAEDCPDMIYVANSGLTRGNKVVLSHLPKERQPETPHYREWYKRHGWEVIEPPALFSGQGDALPCGDRLLIGTGWRTAPELHKFVADNLGYDVVSLQTTGPEYYDIDLAVAVLRPDLIAFCDEALEPASAEKLANLPGVNHILISLEETKKFAANLVSDGQTVVMTNDAPSLAAAIQSHGLKTVELPTDQLAKGGGAIRCTSLALDNL